MKNKKLLFLLTALLVTSCNANSSEEPSLTNSPEESEVLSSDPIDVESSPSFESNSDISSESESLEEPSEPEPETPSVSVPEVPSEPSESEPEAPSESDSEPEQPSSESDPTDEPSDSTDEPTENPNKTKNVTDYLGSDGDVYRVNITTENNVFPYNKEDYINGSINITEQDTSKVLHEDMSMRIKLRGNSTLSADKKPFKVKFDSKQGLFGLEKAKEWVLLANYYDKSNIRNYLAYLTANKLDNLGFQPSYIMVDVYFNNEYYGLFLMCEQMEVNPGRVDIENNVSEDGINSFFLEADERAKDEYAGLKGKCYVSSGGYDFALKGPDADDYVEALGDLSSDDPEKVAEAQEIIAQFDKDTDWLQSFLDGVSEAIYSADYSQYHDKIDVDSFIDYYLVQEFFKNVDVGSTSQNYVIDQANDIVKLAMGPVWDFDIGAGTIDETSSSTYAYYVATDLFMRSRDYYLNSLFNDEYFENLVKYRYTEVRDEVFASVFEELDIVIETLEKAQQRNIERWPLTQERKTWIEVYALSENYLGIDSLQGHYDYLEGFLSDRLALLDAAYLKR